MLDVKSLKDRIRSNIHTAEDLLATMMTPAQGPSQITLQVEYLKRMSGLTYKVNNGLLDIDPVCRDHINDAELKDFSTSMINIGRRASTIYKDLCTREASIARAQP